MVAIGRPGRVGSGAAGVRRHLPAGSLTLALVGVALLLLTGCGPRPVTVTGDDELAAALIEARNSAEPTRLSDLTDYAWDAVYVFFKYSRGSFINETIGMTVVREDYNSDESNVMIFLAGGEVVHAAAVNVGLKPDDDYLAVGAEAWLVPQHPSDLAASSLCLVEEPPDELDEPLC
jgi:hypothetical protein